MMNSPVEEMVFCSFDKMVPVEELEEHPDNPNTHPQKQVRALAAMIKEVGWRAPLTVSKRSGFIVRGHGRLKAARLLGVDAVPVDFQEYETYEAEIADLVADNSLSEMSVMLDEQLSKLVKELDAADFDVKNLGYGPKKLDKMLSDLTEENRKPEVEFTEELHESSNYIVLYFDNDVDWLQAQTLFDLQTVKQKGARKGYEQRGIGRVVHGGKALRTLLGDFES